jgi:hypothetical protein
MRVAVLILFTISSALFAGNADALVGVWKLVSWLVIVENRTPRNEFGLQRWS